MAKKRYSEFMEPLQTRLVTVRLFLQDLVRHGVLVEVVGIKDDFGPTKSDPNMDLIVGSAETALGCDMGTLRCLLMHAKSNSHFSVSAISVNQLRNDNGLGRLSIYLVECLGSSSKTTSITDKISSSNIRGYISNIKRREIQI